MKKSPIKKLNILISILLIISIVICSTCNCFAVAGVDDVVLFTTLGLCAIAYGITINNTNDLVKVGKLIYSNISNMVSDISVWVTNFYQQGVATVDNILLQVLDNFSRTYSLDSVTSVDNVINTDGNSSSPLVIEADVPSSSLNQFIAPNSTVGNYYNGTSISVFLNNFYYSFSYSYSVSNISGVTPVYGEILPGYSIPVDYTGNLNYDLSLIVLCRDFSNSIISSNTFDLGNFTYNDYSINTTFGQLLSSSGVSSSFDYSVTSVTSSLNTVNTVISVSNGLTSTFDVYDGIRNIPSDWNDVFGGLQAVNLVNNPVYNPQTPTSGLKSGDVLNFPNGIVNQNGDSFTVNNVGPDVLNRSKVVGGTGAIVPESDGTSSLNLPILGNILQWLINIFNKIVEFFQGVVSSLGSILSSITTGFSNLVNLLQTKLQSIINYLSSIASAVVGYALDFFDALGDYIGNFISYISSFNLFENFFSHFLPLPVAQFLWTAWRVTVFMGIFCLILSFL